MSEQLLSAMLDGECTTGELQTVLAALERSPELRARWSRMCLTRDALAGTRVRKAAPDFAAGVMSAIDAEPAIAQTAKPKVVPMRPAAPVIATRRVRRWQPLVGLAAAASIATVVVVGGRNILQQPVGLSSPVASVGAKSADVVPVSLAENGVAEPVETRWTQLDAAAAKQLNDYLMEHSNSRAESGMGGSLSYARLAVRTADYRPADEQR